MKRSGEAGVGSSETQKCLICGQPCGDGDLLCSHECLLQANREIDENVVVLRRRSAAPHRHVELAARNGYLTSALVGWTVDHADDNVER